MYSHKATTRASQLKHRCKPTSIPGVCQLMVFAWRWSARRSWTLAEWLPPRTNPILRRVFSVIERPESIWPECVFINWVLPFSSISAPPTFLTRRNPILPFVTSLRHQWISMVSWSGRERYRQKGIHPRACVTKALVYYEHVERWFVQYQSCIWCSLSVRRTRANQNQCASRAKYEDNFFFGETVDNTSDIVLPQLKREDSYINLFVLDSLRCCDFPKNLTETLFQYSRCHLQIFFHAKTRAEL